MGSHAHCRVSTVLPARQTHLERNEAACFKQVAWWEGGNYRHGRRESIGFRVTDQQGREMPVIVPFMLRGGIVTTIELQPGKASFFRRVALRSYCRTLPPGTYSIEAAYRLRFQHRMHSRQVEIIHDLLLARDADRCSTTGCSEQGTGKHRARAA